VVEVNFERISIIVGCPHPMYQIYMYIQCMGDRISVSSGMEVHVLYINGV
jgi:hypothetical protein